MAISATRILTNKHCTSGTPLQSVRTYEQQLLAVRVVYESEKYDFAVLEVPFAVLKAAKLGRSDSVRIGDDVTAVGHPFGHAWTVTFGNVNNVNIKTGFAEGLWIAHTAPINPGNSGGPLFNAAGEVVGINTWRYIDSTLAFALSIDLILTEVAEQ